ncbi:MAG: hypothetical protein EB060_04780 [Proteobacteria bacterium]|nr:hypothetical protein [Pseudomonadota bacterium]
MECKYEGPARKSKRGSKKLEVIGWMMFPFGLPYTIWRMVTKIKVCKHCGGQSLLPLSSDAGKRLSEIARQELTGGKTLITAKEKADTVPKPSAPLTPPPPRRAPSEDPGTW